MLQHVIFAEDLKMFSFALTGDNGDPLQKKKKYPATSKSYSIFTNVQFALMLKILLNIPMIEALGWEHGRKVAHNLPVIMTIWSH